MEFLYPFLNYLQPGILWPQIAPYKPMLIASLIAGFATLRGSAKPNPALTKAYLTHPSVKWLLFYVVVQVISVYYSGVLGMLEKLDFWDVFAIFTVISLYMIKDAKSLRRYVWGTILGSGYVIFYALHAVAVNAPWIQIQDGRAGAYGMYMNQNDYSFIIIMVFPFAYLYLRTCRHFWQKLLLAAVMIGGIIGVMLSLSRGGVLALVLEALLIVGTTMRGGRRALVLAIMAVLGTIASVHLFAAREADQAGVYTLKDSEDTRFQLWNAARVMWEAHPILGVGSMRFSEFAPKYAPISRDDRGKVAHNTYLEIAADTGTLGLGSFLLMLWGAWAGIRHARLQDATGDGVIEAQVAAKVMMLGLLFRASFDAKEYDWSFYFLVVVAIATSTLSRFSTRSSVVSEVGPPIPTEVKPAVYGGLLGGRRHS